MNLKFNRTSGFLTGLQAVSNRCHCKFEQVIKNQNELPSRTNDSWKIVNGAAELLERLRKNSEQVAVQVGSQEQEQKWKLCLLKLFTRNCELKILQTSPYHGEIIQGSSFQSVKASFDVGWCNTRVGI